MLFENLDKKIREAAEQHHPAYDEKAWRKMEHLLDQHLPQKKDDRRRLIFFILFFLIIGGGTFTVISRPWNKKPVQSDQLTQDNIKKVEPKNIEKTGNEVTTVQPQIDKINKEGVGDEKNLINQQKEETIGGETINEKSISNNPKNKITAKSQSIKNPVTENRNKAFLIKNQDKNIAVAKENKQQVSPEVIGTAIQPAINRKEEKKDENKINTDIVKQDETKENIKEEVTRAEVKKSAKRINQSKNQNGFSFSVSAGADISKAGASKTGKTTLAYGAGIGYTRNRFTLRTGVYASKKIYWAGANDYKLLYTSTTSKFEGADANCYVIDIPVKLSYNFESGPKGNWFAGAGLSSYLMKRETYIYNYKTTWGNTYTRKSEVKNENKHYFSVLTLSGGFTHQLNNSLSISAEPYIDIPLTGIGEGKVYLKSGGVLMTLSVKPFRK